MAEVVIGLMSGTSLDGVDGVLARFDAQGRPTVLAHTHRPFSEHLREELLVEQLELLQVLLSRPQLQALERLSWSRLAEVPLVLLRMLLRQILTLLI